MLSSCVLIPLRKTDSPLIIISVPLIVISRKPILSVILLLAQASVTSYSLGFSGDQSSGFAEKVISPFPFSINISINNAYLLITLSVIKIFIII